MCFKASSFSTAEGSSWDYAVRKRSGLTKIEKDNVVNFIRLTPHKVRRDHPYIAHLTAESSMFLRESIEVYERDITSTSAIRLQKLSEDKDGAAKVMAVLSEAIHKVTAIIISERKTGEETRRICKDLMCHLGSLTMLLRSR